MQHVVEIWGRPVAFLHFLFLSICFFFELVAKAKKSQAAMPGGSCHKIYGWAKNIEQDPVYRLIMVSSCKVHVNYTAVLLASSSETYMRLLMITVLHLSCEIRQLQAVYARVLQWSKNNDSDVCPCSSMLWHLELCTRSLGCSHILNTEKCAREVRSALTRISNALLMFREQQELQSTTTPVLLSSAPKHYTTSPSLVLSRALHH